MKTVYVVDTPSRTWSSVDKMSRSEDFAVELARGDSTQPQASYASHSTGERSGGEARKQTMGCQEHGKPPCTSATTSSATSGVLNGVPAEHSLVAKAATSQHADRLAKSPIGSKTRVSSLPEPTMRPAVQFPVSVAVGMSGGDPELWVSTQQQLNVMVAPVGVTEEILGSRVFGVHLLASTYLSELTLSDRGIVAADSMPESKNSSGARVSIIVDAGSTVATSASSEAAVASGSNTEAEVILNVIMNEDVSTPADGSLSTQTPSPTSSAAATLVWPESLLRLTRGRDGNTVVWLRDYRVGDQEVSRLVHGLVEGAQSRGMRLERVLLNGREVWASSQKL